MQRGRERWSFESIVRLIAGAVEARARIHTAPARLALGGSRLFGLLVRDVVLTHDELESLMAGLLVSDERGSGRRPIRRLARRERGHAGPELRVRAREELPWPVLTEQLVLASTSPQRRAILEQLRIPFTAVAPSYVEHDPPDADPVTLVRDHAEGKARSVHADGAVTLGVDTTVHLDGRALRQGRRPRRRPCHAGRARRPHAPRGLGPVPPRRRLRRRRARDDRRDVPRRSPRPRSSAYLDSDEWGGRAGSYAIQGLGARLVARIDGDYLNVVGLPAALLIDTLAAHVPKLLQIGYEARLLPP